MTTHDERMPAPAQTAEPEFSGPETEPPLTQDVSPPEPKDAGSASGWIEAQPTRAETVLDDESSMTNVGSTRAETVPQSPEVQRPDDELLFAADTSGLRSRWDDIQAAFVDDPAECVQKADTLVAEVVEQLTVAFSEARSRLEGQWARGEQASTEDLRLALQRYREFFQRLLAV
jgi:hypothetical protein